MKSLFNEQSRRLLAWLLCLLTVMVSRPAVWAADNETPLQYAEWIAMEPLGEVTTPLIHAPFVKKEIADRPVGRYQLPMFRRVFKARKNVRRATLYVCGLGHFEVQLDGRRVGDHFLDPGWTLYNKEAEYVAFDVTQMFNVPADNVLAEVAQTWQRGEHELRVTLGGGFYNIPRGRYQKLAGSFGQPKLRLRLRIEYLTGRDDNILSDASWQVSPSQLTYSSIYGGEVVDLRIEPQWQPVLTLGWDGPKLIEQQGTEVVVYGNYKPINRWSLANGDWVYDLGQNMSGIPALRLRGQAGQEVAVIPAELKNDDGSARNKAVGNWQYHVTLAGTEAVDVEPKFSYTGFRYVQIHGAVPDGEPNPQGLPVIEDILARHTTSVTARHEAGTFTCNSTYFNQLHSLIDWAIRSNLQSVITDCPHREKLGWLEQDHLMMPSMYYRYQLTPLYRKMMRDMEASQFVAGQTLGLGAASTEASADQDYRGMIPTIAPYYTNFGWNFDDTPEWGSAFIISPWYHYEWTGSDELFRQHFRAMERYIEYLTGRAERDDYILAYGLGDWYDLGPKKPGYAQLTSPGVTATATYYYDVMLMAQMARVLADHNPAEAGYSREALLSAAYRYDGLAETIREAYNHRFLHVEERDGETRAYYDLDSQCANAISLSMGLVPDTLRLAVLQSLVADVEQHLYALDHPDEHLYDWGENGPTVITAGDVGYRYMLTALAEGGRHDLIYNMNTRDDVPGYAMQLRKGATALTESWQALESVSNNHLMLGHILEWMYGYLGGIRQAPGSVGWTDVLIAPHPVGEVTDCTVSYESPHGPIKVHWWIEGDLFKIQYTAPKSIQVRVINPVDTGELKLESAS